MYSLSKRIAQRDAAAAKATKEQHQRELFEALKKAVLANDVDEVARQVGLGAKVNGEKGALLRIAAGPPVTLDTLKALHQRFGLKAHSSKNIGTDVAAKHADLPKLVYLIETMGAPVVGDATSAFEGAFESNASRATCAYLLTRSGPLGNINRSILDFAASHADYETFELLVQQGRPLVRDLWSALQYVAESRNCIGWDAKLDLIEERLTSNSAYAYQNTDVRWSEFVERASRKRYLDGNAGRDEAPFHVCRTHLNRILNLIPPQHRAVACESAMAAACKTCYLHSIKLLVDVGTPLPLKVGSGSILLHALEFENLEFLQLALRHGEFKDVVLRNAVDAANRRHEHVLANVTAGVLVQRQAQTLAAMVATLEAYLAHRKLLASATLGVGCAEPDPTPMPVQESFDFESGTPPRPASRL